MRHVVITKLVGRSGRACLWVVLGSLLAVLAMPSLAVAAPIAVNSSTAWVSTDPDGTRVYPANAGEVTLTFTTTSDADPETLSWYCDSDVDSVCGIGINGLKFIYPDSSRTSTVVISFRQNNVDVETLTFRYRALAAGAGGTGSTPVGPTTPLVAPTAPTAPTVKQIKLPKVKKKTQTLGSVSSAGVITVSYPVKEEGVTTVTTAYVNTTNAKLLGLTIPKKAKKVKIGSVTVRTKNAGTQTVKIKLTAKAKTGLARLAKNATAKTTVKVGVDIKLTKNGLSSARSTPLTWGSLRR